MPKASVNVGCAYCKDKGNIFTCKCECHKDKPQNTPQTKQTVQIGRGDHLRGNLNESGGSTAVKTGETLSALCIICKEKFYPREARINTCSEECSRERKKRYNKEYQHNNLDKTANSTRKWAHNNKDKVNEKQKRNYKINKDKYKTRVKTNQDNEKTGICNDCKEKKKTEFYHLSYEPNIFIEICRVCHNKRHGRETHV